MYLKEKKKSNKNLGSSITHPDVSLLEGLLVDFHSLRRRHLFVPGLPKAVLDLPFQRLAYIPALLRVDSAAIGAVVLD